MASLYTGDTTPSRRAQDAHLTDYIQLPRAHTSPYLDAIECGEEDVGEEEALALNPRRAEETTNTGVASAAVEMTAGAHVEMSAGVHGAVEAQKGPFGPHP